MKTAIRWMIANRVAANLLMLLFIIGGFAVSTQVKQEVFPNIAVDLIQISMVYSAAGPQEVEEGIVLKIEENLSSIEGIKEIHSQISEGLAIVNAELYPDENVDSLLQDIKNEVDKITSFPEGAEKPIIKRVLYKTEVLTLAVYGNIPEKSLRQYAEQTRDELLELNNITQVELQGIRPYEISIEIPEENLRQYHLTLDQVAAKIHKASLDLPGGALKTKGGDILIRTKERRYNSQGYGSITILAQKNGSEVKLADIAHIHDGFRQTDEMTMFDSQPAAMLQVYRTGNQTPKDISRTIKHFVQQKKAVLPANVKLSIWKDHSESLESRMGLLIKNGVLGLGLVWLVLSLFLNARLAWWVLLGIPISFFGVFLAMPLMNTSINMISLFAFIMALGIVVDDAIVVGENIFQHRAKGESFADAAEKGALEVASPVIFATLTSLAAFAPLLYVSGSIGNLVSTIPKIVIVILIVSLIECLFILPFHLSSAKKSKLPANLDHKLNEICHWFSTKLDDFIHGSYTTGLRFCLNNRALSTSIAISLLILTIGVVTGGIIKFHFMPKVQSDLINVSIEMPEGTPVKETRRVLDFIESQAKITVRHFDTEHAAKNSIVRHIYSTIGKEGGNTAHISLFLVPSEKRSVTSSEVARYWRKRVGNLPEVETLTFNNNLLSMGANLNIRLSHNNYKVLEDAAGKVRVALAQYPGVEDIKLDLSRGRRELEITLRPDARTLGITEELLGRQLRAAFYGVEALRIQRGRNEVRVMVRYPENERLLWNFENMRIRTPDGAEIPLLQAATVVESKSFNQIKRADRKRVTNIAASVDNSISNADEILADLQKGLLQELKAEHPGLIINLEGERKERDESLASMKTGFVLSLLVIYALLAIPLQSYSQPILIMAAIPFGVVGAIWGHFILGYDLAIMSFFGVVALAGVVVNDSLLLIDYANKQVKQNHTHIEAIIEACQRRFRPIVLTSLTTAVGLMPIVLENSIQAQFLIPMAISLSFGILFATVITLIIIPLFYMVLVSLQEKRTLTKR